MDERHIHLGMATAFRRFEMESGAAPGGTKFERRLRQIESGASELNLDPAAVHIGAEIAALEPELGEDQRLALILLITASLVALEEGSTRLPVTGPEASEPMRRILSALCGDAFGPAGPETVAQEIADLLASGGAARVIARSPDEYKPLVYVAPFIYHQRLLAAESRLAKRLRTRLEDTGPTHGSPAISAALADLVARPSLGDSGALTLSPEQREAVAKAAGRRFAVISGGPGTGKTSIIVAILRVFVRLGVKPQDIALAAPTGKAAFRMGESVRQGLETVREAAEADRQLLAACPEPSTVHRLLAYSPGRQTFFQHENNPLSASVVVVDETSMLDLSLMERLVGAVRPEAQLIMLGDADQLPSVAAGAVFRELVPSTAIVAGGKAEDRRADACTRLTHSYRMDLSDEDGRAVLALAGGINEGDGMAAAGSMTKRERPADLRFGGVEFLSQSSTGIELFLDRWYEFHIRGRKADQLGTAVFVENETGFEPESSARLSQLFELLTASRILCVTRRLPGSGAEHVNASLHRRAADALGGASRPGPIFPGEPVMVVRNDYERMLFNGDQGIVVRVRRPPRRETPMVVFARSGGFVAFHLGALRESLELCYATTVHKAQGSEFDSVAVVLPEKDLPILTRESLYTAVSRARRSVVVFGDERLFEVGIARKCDRYSGLRGLLIGRACT